MIGRTQARIGLKFIFNGSTEKCIECKLYNSCSKPLEVGRIYEVKNVRDKRFPCILHGSDAKLVEVEETDYEVNIETRSAVLNALFKYEPIECDLLCLQQRKKCVPVGLFKNDFCRIVEVGSMIQCPIGMKISSVRLHREKLNA